MTDEPTAPDPRQVGYGELPEVARALRAFGSARSGAGAMQSLFFRPLLDARRKAADARTPEARVRAFDAGELRAGLERCLARIVAEWPDAREPARRAIRAQLSERVADYENHLVELAGAGVAVRSADEAARLDSWRAWTARLHATFHAADRAWLAIQGVVETLTPRSRT